MDFSWHLENVMGKYNGYRQTFLHEIGQQKPTYHAQLLLED
jgi:hypothetical protein